MADLPPPPLSQPHPVARLSARRPARFRVEPDAETAARIAAWLGITEVRGLVFAGEIRPSGRNDHVLEGHLTASVVQPCVVTLGPVTTGISEPVLRRYLADYAPPAAEEAEIPEDDSAEPLPAVIDTGHVALEALALALPAWPRAPDAAIGEAVIAPPGVAPLSDDALRPFAGLAALRERLGEGEAPPEEEGGDGPATPR